MKVALIFKKLKELSQGLIKPHRNIPILRRVQHELPNEHWLRMGPLSRHMKVLTNADDYFTMLWDSMDKAKNRVHIAMYAMDNSHVANKTLKKLTEAASRGVSVILYVDGWRDGTLANLRSALHAAGGTIKRLNPITSLIPFMRSKWRAVNRHHEKLVTIDNDVFIGSGNIAGPYAGPKLGTNLFKDLYVVVKRGPLLPVFKFFSTAMEIPFDSAWGECNKTYKSYEDEDESFNYLFEIPGENHELRERIIDMLKAANEKIEIIQPYFENVPQINEELKNALKRGVKVEIVTAKNRDLFAYRHLYNRLLFKDLIGAGCKVYEDPDRYLHMKLYIVDGKCLTCGTLLIIFGRFFQQ